MIFDIRLPSITAPTDAGKIEEIRSYLFQTVKEINFALNSIDGVNHTEVESKELDGNSLFAVITFFAKSIKTGPCLPVVAM